MSNSLYGNILVDSGRALKDLYSLRSQLERINLQCKNSDMTYSLNLDSNFEDRLAYTSSITKFIQETAVLNSLQKIIEQGLEVHVPMLYSWRSLSQTFPPINDDDQNKEKAYRAILKVLTDQTESIFDFYNFIKNEARPAFVKEINRSANTIASGESVSDGIFFILGRFIYMFFVLDHLTNVKTSLKNDFSAYKRYNQLVGEQNKDSEILIQEITMFLANKNQIINHVKDDIKSMTNIQEFLFEIYNQCCSMIEEKSFLLPQSRYECIGTICAILYMLNNMGGKSITKLDNKKRFSLARADKIFREYPLISLMADLQFNVVVFLNKLLPNDTSTFTVNEIVSNPKPFDIKFSLVATQTRLRDSHFLVMNELTQMKSHLLIAGGGNVQDSDCNLSLKKNWDTVSSSGYFEVLRRAFLHLSELSTSLNSSICWKMANPPKLEKQPDGSYKIIRVNDFERVALESKDISQIDTYELLTKYNYSVVEKSAFSQLITYIKSLYNVLKEMETVAVQIISAKIYSMMQDLIHNKLNELFVKSSRSVKLDSIRAILTTLRELCGDHNVNTTHDTVSMTMKKKTTPSINFNKTVPPLSTQLYMFYTLLSSMVSNKDLRKELDATSLGIITEISNSRHIYSGLINFNNTLQKCTDISYLWFREFFLEMSTTKQVQFPIECSIPWILINYLIESADPSQTSNLLYLLDIYNDSAEFALKHLKRRYMYDELEAEVNLIFEQLVYNLAEKIYIYYRSYAATIFLNKGYRASISRMLRQYDKLNIPEAQISMQSVHRYWIFFRQRTVQILGRDVDLAHLLSQRLILSVRKSLSSAMLVLEASSITNIFDFDMLIQVTKLTHKLLSDHLTNLPTFDIMFDEANNSVNGKSMSRITLHILWDLINDFIPNFAFCSQSNKFVRGIVRYSTPVNRPSTPVISAPHLFGNKSLSLMITSFNQITRSFVGQGHWVLLIKYIGYHGIAIIIEQISRYVSVLLNEKLSPYVDVLRQGMPSKISLPRFTYGFIGNVKYYSANFDNIFKYKDLYPCVFQTMREIGNCLVIIYCFENALKHFESYQVTYTAPYIGVVPSDIEETTNLYNSDFMSSYKEQQNETVKPILSKVHILSSEKLSFGLSIFNYLLYNMKSVLVGSTWDPPIPSNAAIALENCNEFHRIFAVLCLAMAQTYSSTNATPEQIFGDGILWCGVSITTMLGMAQRAEGLDFINHAINVADNESIRELMGLSTVISTLKPQSKTKNTDDTQDVLIRMKSISSRRRKIECIISAFYNSPYFDNIEKIRCFGVPKFSPP